jgi:hypothetical protein
MATASSLTKNGITWTFSIALEYGQYINGDYWVVDPGSGITISSTTHTVVSGVASGEHHTINPRWGSHAYDSRQGGYDAGQAVSLPVVLTAGDCIVTVTNYTAGVTNQTYLDTAAILNVVDEIQDASNFRPPYCRPSRVADSSTDALLFSQDSITSGKWALLPKKSHVGIGSIPSLASTLALVSGPWIDHLGESWCGEIAPHQYMKAYGEYVSQDVSTAFGQLCLDYTDSELKELATHLIQIGIDNYATTLDGGKWYANGGLMNGRKLPITFAAVMLNDTSMKAFSRWDPVNTLQPRFSEDGQTYYFDDSTLPLYQGPAPSFLVYSVPGSGRVAVRGVKGWLDIANGGTGDLALWRMNNAGDVTSCVAHEHKPLSDWNSVYDNGEGKYEAYRLANTAHAWIGQCLFMYLFGNDELISVWDHNAYFDYCIRWMSQSNSIEQTQWLAKYGTNIGQQQYTGLTFVDDLWSTYPNEIRILREEETIFFSQSIRLRY